MYLGWSEHKLQNLEYAIAGKSFLGKNLHKWIEMEKSLIHQQKHTTKSTQQKSNAIFLNIFLSGLEAINLGAAFAVVSNGLNMEI